MLIIGTGALASFLIPRLHAVGENLQIFGGPSERMAALEGMALSGATSDPLEVKSHDRWLVVCKAWQNESKLAQLRRSPAPASLLVLQNGLEPEAAWRGAGLIEVERAITTYGLRTVAPGRSLGGEHGEVTLRAGSGWSGVLSRAGLCVREERDMRRAVWAKLVVNASLNVVACLGDLSNGQVLEKPASRRWAGMAATEVAGLAVRLGVDLGGLDPVRAVESVARATSANICSTLADLRAGRPTEYPEINGALLALARERCLRLPVLEYLDRRFALVATAPRRHHEQSVAS